MDSIDTKGEVTHEDLVAENVEQGPPEPVYNADNPENISYGRSDVLAIFESPYVCGAAFLASMGGFSFGYDQGVISVINVMDQFHERYPLAVTAFGKSFMTAMLELGAFIGCLFMPTLADKISRKRAIMVVAVIFNVGAIMQTAAPNYGTLVAGRTIGGIGVGTLAMVCGQPYNRRPCGDDSESTTWKVDC